MSHTAFGPLLPLPLRADRSRAVGQELRVKRGRRRSRRAEDGALPQVYRIGQGGSPSFFSGSKLLQKKGTFGYVLQQQKNVPTVRSIRRV